MGRSIGISRVTAAASVISGSQRLSLAPPDGLQEKAPMSGSVCLGHEVTLDTAMAQFVRWALGSHSQQRAALARPGIGAFRLPTALATANGQPRRLLRVGGQWADRWRTSDGSPKGFIKKIPHIRKGPGT